MPSWAPCVYNLVTAQRDSDPSSLGDVMTEPTQHTNGSNDPVKVTVWYDYI